MEKPTSARRSAGRLFVRSTAAMSGPTTKLSSRSRPSRESAHSVSDRVPLPSGAATTKGRPASASRAASATTPPVTASSGLPGTPCKKYTTGNVTLSGTGGR
jgi:hypothetical protein